MYLENPYYRRIRDATLARGFRYDLDDERSYFGFPLIHLDSILETRKLPYRPNYRALLHLERSRPGHFELRDLRLNRPAPNYLLHESAHAVAFHALFGRPRSVRLALSAPTALVRIMLGEAFAMASEYFAACAVGERVQAWFFSINSYRHRTQHKTAMGELASELGLERLVRATVLAFLCNNFLIERLDRRTFARLCELAELGAVPAPAAAKLRRALSSVMVMSPEFRLDTARLFLGMFGRPRAIRRVLARDPLALLAADERALAAVGELGRVLTP